MGSFSSQLSQCSPALSGKLCRFIPNTGDGERECSLGSIIVYFCGSFSARTSLTVFRNSTMLIAASGYLHKVLLWFFFASLCYLRKEKSTFLYWSSVLQQSCDAPISYNSMQHPNQEQGGGSPMPSPLNWVISFCASPPSPFKNQVCKQTSQREFGKYVIIPTECMEKGGTGGRWLVQDHTSSSAPSWK